MKQMLNVLNVEYPWFITNNNLHKDLKIQYLNLSPQLYYARFHNKRRLHTSPLVTKLLSSNTLSNNPRRRLKIIRRMDLIRIQTTQVLGVITGHSPN